MAKLWQKSAVFPPARATPMSDPPSLIVYHIVAGREGLDTRLACLGVLGDPWLGDLRATSSVPRRVVETNEIDVVQAATRWHAA